MRAEVKAACERPLVTRDGLGSVTVSMFMMKSFSLIERTTANHSRPFQNLLLRELKEGVRKKQAGEIGQHRNSKGSGADAAALSRRVTVPRFPPGGLGLDGWAEGATFLRQGS